MHRSSLGRQKQSWTQGVMFDCPELRLDLTIFLDGPMGRAQIGWALSSWPDDQALEIEVCSPVRLSEVTDESVERLIAVLGRGLKLLPPF